MKLAKAKLMTINSNWLLCEFPNGERRLVNETIVKKLNTEKWSASKDETGLWCGQSNNDRHLYEGGIPVTYVQNLHQVIRSNRKTESIILMPLLQAKNVRKT